MRSMKPLASAEGTERLGDSQKELREWANRSIQQLSGVASRRSCDNGDESGEEVERAHSPASGKEGAGWAKRPPSQAVIQLRSLLQKQHKETSPPLSPPQRGSPLKLGQEGGSSFLSGGQDLVPIISNQPEYIQHLEAEVKFCKDELQRMKHQIRVVVVENDKLQSELKSKTLNETLKDYTIGDSMMDESVATKSQIGPTSAIGLQQRTDVHTWKNELERLKVLYHAQTETLEHQVASLRKELAAAQRECEELGLRLRCREEQTKTVGAPRVGGLCLKCAQHEAVMAETHSNVHVQAIERLTMERDELLAALQGARASDQEAHQREWSACLQVKEAVKMAEEANLHKTRVESQCEQLSRELSHQRERLERDAQSMKERLAGAREEARTEGRKAKEELAQTVTNLFQRVAELEGQLDRAGRERTSLTNQLDDALRKLTSQEQESTRLCVDLRYQLNQAQLKREEVERELRELGAKTTRLREKAAQEVEKLSSELVGCRQRLEAVQKDGGQWQAEALSLAEQLASAQRQLHLTRQEKESTARALGENMEAAAASARERESELAVWAEQMELQQEQRVGELDGLLVSQNSLIGKLREECCVLVARLGELTANGRREVVQSSLEKQHLEETVERLRSRCSAMEEQCVQHGRIHQRMTDRLQQLDRCCRTSAQQVCELLAKQNQLTQEGRTELPSRRRADIQST